VGWKRKRERELDVIIFLQSMSYVRVSIRKTTFNGDVYHFECAFISMCVYAEREREEKNILSKLFYLEKIIFSLFCSW
jgi:hypothetical protein